jgi:hypothetical protein
VFSERGRSQRACRQALPRTSYCAAARSLASPRSGRTTPWLNERVARCNKNASQLGLRLFATQRRLVRAHARSLMNLGLRPPRVPYSLNSPNTSRRTLAPAPSSETADADGYEKPEPRCRSRNQAAGARPKRGGAAANTHAVSAAQRRRLKEGPPPFRSARDKWATFLVWSTPEKLL